MKLAEVKVLIASILTNFVTFTQVAGQINVIGTICPYLLSYFTSIDPSTTLMDILFISTIAYIFESISLPILSLLAHYYSARTLILISTLSTCIISLLSFAFLTPWVFYISYGFCLGLNSTFMAYPSIWLGWEVSKNHKGLFVGVSEASYKLAPLILGFFFTKIINPKNKKGKLVDDLVYYSDSVYSKVPNTLFWSIILNLTISVISIILILKYKNTLENSSESKMTLSKLLKHRNFWYLFVSMFFKNFFYLFLISCYKNLGLLYFNDDHFLNFVALMAFGVTAGFNIMLGYLFDKFQWDRLNYIFMGIELLVTCIGPLMFKRKALFCIWLSASMGISSSDFISVWLLTKKLFPYDNWVFSMVVVSLIFDTVLINFILGHLRPLLGYSALFYLISIVHVICFGLGYFKDRIVVKEKEELLLDR